MKSVPHLITLLRIGAFALGMASAQSHASALVVKDDDRGELRVIAHLSFQKPDGVLDVSAAAADEIERMWNEPQATVRFHGRDYRVTFEISSTLNRRISTSSCAVNVVRILDPVQASARSEYALFGQIGTFYTSDEIGVSTTAAHEFGHGLGLAHDEPDQRAALTPGIMFPRGTLVRSEYQWGPDEAPASAGGTLKPHYRKVRVDDIRKIPFSRVRFNFLNHGCLGDGKPVHPSI